jgi:hypothetical protein
MGDALLFWLMKPVAEIAMVLAILAAVVALYALASLPRWLRQRRCKHERVNEDSACNAWCCACGKNIGFIGAWRDKQ